MGINDVPKEYRDIIIKELPAGRLCNPEEVLSTVNYLIENEYVNGADIDINERFY